MRFRRLAKVGFTPDRCIFWVKGPVHIIVFSLMRLSIHVCSPVVHIIRSTMLCFLFHTDRTPFSSITVSENVFKACDFKVNHQRSRSNQRVLQAKAPRRICLTEDALWWTETKLTTCSLVSELTLTICCVVIGCRFVLTSHWLVLMYVTVLVSWVIPRGLTWLSLVPRRCSLWLGIRMCYVRLASWSNTSNTKDRVWPHF